MSNQSSGGSKKRILTRWEWFFIIICIAILLYFLLQNAGVELFSTANEVEMTDNPHPDN